MTLQELGHRVAMTRRERHQTQSALALSAGVSRPTIALLENGRAGELGFTKITRILAALGLELKLSEANQQRPTLDELMADNSNDDNRDDDQGQP